MNAFQEFYLSDLDPRIIEIMQAVPFGIVQFDADGKILFWNAAAEKIYGYSAEEIVGKSALLTITPKSAFPFIQKISKKLFAGEGPVQFVRESRRKDGHIIFCEWILSPVFSVRHELTSIIGIVMDHTRLVNIEKELQQSEQRFKAFLENDISGDYITTPDRGPIYCNRRFLEIFGFESFDEFMEFDYKKLYKNPEDREKLFSILQKEGRIFNYQIEMYDKNGHSKFIIENAMAEFDEDGKLAVIYGNCLDLTDIYESEQEKLALEAKLHQVQKMEAVGRLAAGVAHDFNNMLSIIWGSVQLARIELPKDHSILSLLKEIETAAEHSAQLSRKLLTFAKKQHFDPIPINLNQSIREDAKLLRRMLGENIELKLNLQDGLWPVFMDPSQFDQILANLAANSRDAIRGTGTVLIDTKNLTINEDYAGQYELARPGDYVLLQFGDTGPGISKEIMDKIFDPFFTTKSASGGTGLGLSTVYGIVKQNGGFISVYSETGYGTVFKLFFPRYKGLQNQERKQADYAIPKGNETILIVDDQEHILKMLKRFLSGLGYTVHTAKSADKALSELRNYRDDIQLILCDVIMPKQSGPEICERAAKIQPKAKIIYMSGYAWEQITETGLNSSEINLIHKPFNLEELAKKIRLVLDTETGP